MLLTWGFTGPPFVMDAKTAVLFLLALQMAHAISALDVSASDGPGLQGADTADLPCGALGLEAWRQGGLLTD